MTHDNSETEDRLVDESPDQHTSLEEIYLNMRHIMSIKAAGGPKAEE